MLLLDALRPDIGAPEMDPAAEYAQSPICLTLSGVVMIPG